MNFTRLKSGGLIRILRNAMKISVAPSSLQRALCSYQGSQRSVCLGNLHKHVAAKFATLGLKKGLAGRLPRRLNHSVRPCVGANVIIYAPCLPVLEVFRMIDMDPGAL